MFVLAKPVAGDLLYFQFGQPLDPREKPFEERVSWILEDYNARRDELLLLALSRVAAHLQDRLAGPAETIEEKETLIRALGFIRVVSSAGLVESHLRDQPKEIVLESILALGRIGAHQSVPKLEEFLDSPDPDLKRAAVVALSRQIKRASFQKLDEAAAGDTESRQAVRRGKRRMDALEAKDLHRFTVATLEASEWEDLLPMLEVFGQHVTAIISDTKQAMETRRRALNLIAISGYRRAIPAVEQVLREEDENLVPMAVVAAGKCRADNCIEYLARMLRSADVELGRIIIQALGEMRSTDSLSPLLSKWSEYEGVLRPEIRLALRRLGSFAGQESLRELLWTDGSWNPAAIYIVPDDLQLHRRYTEGLFDIELSGPGKRDAILLLGLLGSARESAKLLDIAASPDEDPEIRDMAGAASSRMERSAR